MSFFKKNKETSIKRHQSTYINPNELKDLLRNQQKLEELKEKQDTGEKLSIRKDKNTSTPNLNIKSITPKNETKNNTNTAIVETKNPLANLNDKRLVNKLKNLEIEYESVLQDKAINVLKIQNLENQTKKTRELLSIIRNEISLFYEFADTLISDFEIQSKNRLSQRYDEIMEHIIMAENELGEEYTEDKPGSNNMKKKKSSNSTTKQVVPEMKHQMIVEEINRIAKVKSVQMEKSNVQSFLVTPRRKEETKKVSYRKTLNVFDTTPPTSSKNDPIISTVSFQEDKKELTRRSNDVLPVSNKEFLRTPLGDSGEISTSENNSELQSNDEDSDKDQLEKENRNLRLENENLKHFILMSNLKKTASPKELGVAEEEFKKKVRNIRKFSPNNLSPRFSTDLNQVKFAEIPPPRPIKPPPTPMIKKESLQNRAQKKFNKSHTYTDHTNDPLLPIKEENPSDKQRKKSMEKTNSDIVFPVSDKSMDKSESDEGVQYLKELSLEDYLFNSANMGGKPELIIDLQSSIGEKLRERKSSKDYDVLSTTAGRRTSVSSKIEQYTQIYSTQISQKRNSENNKIETLLKELLDTEKDYVEDLKIILEVFQYPLQEIEPPILSEEQIEQIFFSFEILYKFHFKFLGNLEQVLSNPTPVSFLTEIFMKFSQEFESIYISHCSGQSNARVVRMEASKTNQRFAQFLKERSSMKECRKLDLASFLIKPVQRICKYPLILKEIRKLYMKKEDNGENKEGKLELDANESDLLQKAHSTMTTILNNSNESLIFAESQTILEKLEKSLNSKSSLLALNLVDGKRTFVCESNLVFCRWNFEKKRKEKIIENLRFILLSDILLICDSKQDNLLLKELFKLRDTIVIDIPDNSFPPLYGRNAKNVFEIHRIDENPIRYIVFCNSSQQKRDWMGCIEQSKTPKENVDK